jgi:Protein of unknown function (DUF2959)
MGINTLANYHSFTRAAYSSGLLLTLVWLCGCASNGYRQSDAVSRSLHDAATDIRSESQAIDATVAALNDLVSQPATDLKPQFRRFSEALNRLEDVAGQAEKTRRHMEEKGARYFAVWDQQLGGINYGIIHEQSESRFSAVTNRFYSINGRYAEAQGVVHPLIRYFNDIRTALSVDLTMAGLESVKSIASNAEQNSRKVQTELTGLADELAISGARMSSVVQEKLKPVSDNRTPVRSETQPGNSPPLTE